jgi:hypothetical protein
MGPGPRISPDMISIDSYEQLDKIAGVFAAGGLSLLGLVGDPGLAKSRSLRAAVEAAEASGKRFHWVSGQVTAFQLYIDLYHQQDADLLVIDDVDSFYTDKSLVRMLKCLCETEGFKRLSWNTNAKALEEEEIPRHYFVSMKVAIIANDFERLNKNVQALQDRGHIFAFEPSAAEVHARAETFCKDEEILGFVGEHLVYLDGRLSLRDYVKAAEAKAAGLDWRAMFAGMKGLNEPGPVLAQLLRTPFATEEERVAEYRRRTGLSRPSYFRHKKALRIS